MKKTDSSRKAAFDVISNAGDSPEVIGQIWWTGRSIESDVPRLMKELKGSVISDKRFSDGLPFFNLLPLHFRSGYLTVKRVK